MRRRILGLLAAAVALGALTADAGQFIVRTRSSADSDEVSRRYGLTVIRPVPHAGSDEIRVVSAPSGGFTDDGLLVAALATDPLVVGFDIDARVRLVEAAPASAALAQSTAAILEGFPGEPMLYFGSAVPPAFVRQPAASVIRLAAAHDIATGSGVVAVIDTGVDPGHLALSGALVDGYDFVNDLAGVPTDWAEIAQSTAAILEQANPANTVAVLNQSTAAILEQSTAAILEGVPLPAAFGHGTMVASLVRLVAPTALIMPIKAFRSDGTAELSDLVAAIYYAVDHGATVINMSFTLVEPSPALLDAVTYAASRGVLCVAAVGNDGVSATEYPASWPGVIAVASTTMNDERSAFSNWGPRVDMAAPGDGLIVAYPGNHYAAAWGTSFATALVSGAVALMAQFRPGQSESAALEILEDGACVPSSLGEARLDLYDAVRRWR